MTDLRIGSLCSGYGGLDLGVQAAVGGTVAWHCQYDPDDSKQYAAQILAHHWPHVPNHGDITQVDFTTVEPVDILTAGFPCQDVSLAGKRAGIAEGTRSGLWAHVARAIHELQPRMVVIENVRGLLSAKADRGLGPDQPDLDPATGSRRVLRALGAVLGDLADLGFDAEWQILRASDVCAPHQRERVFLLAWPAAADTHHERVERARPSRREPQRHLASADREPAHTQGQGLQGIGFPGRTAERRAAAEDAHGAARGERRIAAPGQAESRGARADARGRGGVPDAGRSGSPAPAHTNRGGLQGHPERDGGPEVGQPERALGLDADGRGIQREAADHAESLGWREGRPEPARLEGRPDAAIGSTPNWGTFEAAVLRWEHALGRRAPRPTDDRGRLTAAFVEWMMGLPAGHVTGVPGLTRAAQLKALGNGVVPQQAAAAVQFLLERIHADEAA